MNQKLLTKQLINSSTKYLPDDIAVSVRSVSKKFCRNLRRSMAYGIGDLAKNLAGFQPDSTNLKKDEFWALDDISFDLKKGEILGIIGGNGSGKTTLLRVLSGIFPPDKGHVFLRGKAASLIAIGAGFHPHMTGRENIYLNGTILGMNRHQIASKFDEIADFAEIGEFIDAPVATYSSGMHVRLGFSVAVHLNPQLLFIDEVLAVGDHAFKRKSQEKIKELVASGISILFVSHNLTQVARLCDKVMHLNKGKVKGYGDPDDIVGLYMLESEEEVSDSTLYDSESIKRKAQEYNTNLISLNKFEILNEKGDITNVFNTFDDIIFKFYYQTKQKNSDLIFDLRINKKDDTELIRTQSNRFKSYMKDSDKIITCKIPHIPLRRGIYSISLYIGDEHGLVFVSPYFAEFIIESIRNDPVELSKRNILELKCQWDKRDF